jgi:hypothetical protein
MGSDVTSKNEEPTTRPARWVMVVGYLTGLLTLLFFMGLVVARLLGLTADVDRFLVLAVLALGLALSFSFIGGTAGAQGKLPLGLANKYPISFSVGGGVAVFVIVLLVGSAIPLSSDPMEAVDFDLRFTADEPLPVRLSFIQTKPHFDEYYITKQRHFYEREHIPLPPSAEEYRAKFTPAVEDSERTDSIPDKYEICITREPDRSIAPGETAYAMLTCPRDRKCIVHPVDDPGWVQDCRAEGASRWPDGLVGAAFAQPRAIGWTVPSLDTLRRLSEDRSKRGPGYTEFTITTDPLPEVGKADSISYSVRVNGMQIYVDGWRPDELRMPLDARKGLQIEFGLQNLSFSGQHQGREEIEVTIDFLAGDRRLAPSLTLSRLYAACTTDGKEVSDPDPVKVSWEPREGVGARWTARYIPPHVEDRFEIIVRSSTDPVELEGTKRTIDRAGQSFNEHKVVGVLRPPLDGNPNYAVMIGLERPNGQTQFTFAEEPANELCRWTHAHLTAFGGAVRADAFRMENDLPYDHPQRRIPCQRL